MSTAIDPNPETRRPELEDKPGSQLSRALAVRGTTSLRVGVATLWLSVIVLLPLAAIVWSRAREAGRRSGRR